MTPRSALAVAILAPALPGAALGCGGEGSPAAPTSTPGVLSEAGAVDASIADAAEEAYAVCPPGLDASFADLLGRVLATSSCGTNNPNSCHSTSGSVAASNLLDFSLDAGAVYQELLKPALNISGDTPVRRVEPGDAGASMLYIKLTLKTLSNAHYGAGMPLTAPGSVCPEALDAFKTWIDTGARRR